MNNIKNTMRKRSILFTLIIIILIGWIFSGFAMGDESQGVVWEATIDVDIQTSQGWVMLGESPDSWDGAPMDSNDAGTAPPPPSGGLGSSLADDVSMGALCCDYRHYPDTSKTWNLTVTYNVGVGNSNLTVTVDMTWNSSDFVASEYGHVNLTDGSFSFLVDMIAQSSYTFEITDPYPANAVPGSESFHIVCKCSRAGDDDDDTSGGDDDDDYVPPVNQPPVANVSASDTFGFVGSHITFDGSLSSDSDGYITSWSWDFGDGTTGDGEITTHDYSKNGTYAVKLTVTDDNDAADTDTISVVIGTANNPPSTPIVNGVTSGNADTKYTYTAISTDKDNDSISYTFNWGDSTTNISDFLPNETTYVTIHEWAKAGIYTINVTAADSETTSKKVKMVVLIDVEYVAELGYLLDIDGDGVYDLFYSNITGVETTVDVKENETYLIDSNDGDKWDYCYDSLSGTLSPYKTKEMPSDDSWKSLILPLVAIVLIIVGIVSIAAIIKK